MHPEPVDVLVIGEALVDIVDDGLATEHPGGSPANVALGLGRRDVDVALLSDLGRDPRGSRIVRHLEASRVRVLEGSFSDRSTSSATATIAADGSATYRFDVQWRVSDAPVPVAPRVVHTGSIAAFLEPGWRTVLEHVERLRPQLVTFDPNIRPALLGGHTEALDSFHEWAARAHVVKLSDEDALWLYPSLSPEEVATTVASLGPALVVVTRGADGAVLTTGRSLLRVPPVPTTVTDTIGAGDTYMASLIADLLILGDIRPDDETALRLGRRAARAAAITVARRGADLPWTSDLPPIQGDAEPLAR